MFFHILSIVYSHTYTFSLFLVLCQAHFGDVFALVKVSPSSEVFLVVIVLWGSKCQTIHLKNTLSSKYKMGGGLVVITAWITVDMKQTLN